jgi:thiol:disulfide interchange protein DsbD
MRLAGLVLLLTSASFAQNSGRVVKLRSYLSLDAIRPGDFFQVAVVLDISDGYHINAHVPTLDYLIPTTVAFSVPRGIRVADPQFPAPTFQTFAFAPESSLAVYQGETLVIANALAESFLQPGNLLIQADVRVQACNNQQCLPPSKLSLEIPVLAVAPGTSVNEINKEIFSRGASVAALSSQDFQTISPSASAPKLVQFGSASPRNFISEMIASRGLLLTLMFVFVSGLALNTTPCVYPIIPITIGFFANQSEGRLRRTFLMASAYVFGMAITYSILGVIASMSKGLFGAALQNPVVLVSLAMLMAVLALSMFGVYEFRLPTFLSRFAAKASQAKGGVAGAFLMGLMMGIVAAPCIGPFVLGLLVHVGTRGDPLYGFFLFFVLALGLGLPYLILGTFSGAIKRLPRSGEWMITVRRIFGLILIGMAIYFILPLLGRLGTPVLVMFLMISACYWFFWEARRATPRQFGWVLRLLAACMAVAAVMLAIPEKTESSVPWQPYSRQALETARQQGKPVIIDAFADWCIPCKELEKSTFSHSDILGHSRCFVWLKLDLTRDVLDSEAGRAREHFGIRGVPTILFFDTNGREHTEVRLEGFEKPASFLARMEQVAACE